MFSFFLYDLVCVKMVSRMKSKEKIKEAIYEILDKFEREQSQQIRVFWKCVFQEVIMNQYPTLRLLHKDVMDGMSGLFIISELRIVILHAMLMLL